MEIRYIDPKKLKPHPLNESLIPPMTPEEFEALVEDVKEKGVLQPLEVQKGTNFILDGRNRWKAAIEANLETIPYREVEVPEEEVALYILERVPTHRSLSPGIRAALAAEWVEVMKPHVKRGRPEKGGKNSTFFSEDQSPPEATKDATKLVGKGVQKEEIYGGGRNSTTINTGRLREQAAKKFGVNDHYVQIAWNLKRLVPESFQLLKAGELSIQDAQRIVAQARLELGEGELIPELKKLFDLGKFKPEAAWHIALLPKEDQRTLLEILGIKALEELTASESKKLKLVFKNAKDTKEFKKLQEELEAIKAERDALREEVAEAQRQIESYEQELAELEARVQEAANEVSPEVAARISFLEDEIARLKEERDEYQADRKSVV